MTQIRWTIAAGIGLLLAAAATAQTPLTQAITYQGELKSGGLPADGSYDMTFSLWRHATSAAPADQINSAVCVDNVSVVDGVFTVSLNFGAGAFNGDARWLNIGVRPDSTAGNCGSGAYTILAPRQPLTAAPYALYALNGPGSGGYWTLSGTNIYNNNTGRVGIGTSNPERVLHTVGNAVLFERAVNDAAVILRNTSNGVINALFGLRATALNDGYAYVSDQAQSPTIFFQDTNVGVGVAAPEYKLDVNGRAQLRQGGNSSAGIYFYQNTPAEERGFVGMRNDDQIGLYGTEGASWGLVMNVDDGHIGINNTNPQYAQLAVTADTGFISAVSGDGYYGVSGSANDPAGYGGSFGGSGFLGSGNALLVWGDSHLAGKVGIGTTTVPAGVKLAVNGKVLCEELEVQLSEDWPDYVFADDYALMSLDDVDSYVRAHKHLPGVPSAAEVKSSGVNVGDMQTTLLRKMEEMTLHMIELNRQMAALRSENERLRAEIGH